MTEMEKWKQRALAAEAKVAKVEALADEWGAWTPSSVSPPTGTAAAYERGIRACVESLRAVLADAPAEPLTIETAPLGTFAPAYIGGGWTKVERGWRAVGGSTFPRPGGDWTGRLVLPAAARSSASTTSTPAPTWSVHASRDSLSPGQIGGSREGL